MRRKASVYIHRGCVAHTAVVPTVKAAPRLRQTLKAAEADVLWMSAGYPADLAHAVATASRRQALNHFPGMGDVCSKKGTAELMAAMGKLYPGAFDFVPRTFALGDDEAAFLAAARAEPRTTWIVKPDLGSQGEGIHLVSSTRPEDALQYAPAVVQEYIDRPMLLNGFKFDFRVYVLLYGVDPPRAAIYTEGLTRFCTKPYARPTARNMHETFAHLTNYSLNKYSNEYVHEGEADETGAGESKRTMGAVFAELEELGVDCDDLWDQIHTIAARTVWAMSAPLSASYNTAFGLPPRDRTSLHRQHGPQSFQVLGLDVIVDEDGRAWLLEINGGPSMRTDAELATETPGVYVSVPSEIDRGIKEGLLESVFDVVLARRRWRGRESWSELCMRDELGQDEDEDEDEEDEEDEGDDEEDEGDEEEEEEEEEKAYLESLTLDEIEDPRLPHRIAAVFRHYCGVRGGGGHMSGTRFAAMLRQGELVEGEGRTTRVASLELFFQRCVRDRGAMDMLGFLRLCIELPELLGRGSGRTAVTDLIAQLEAHM